MSNKQLLNSPTEEVVAKVNRLGGVNKAAAHFGVSPAKLSRWLNGQGYFSKPQYVKEAQTQQQS
jgi:hypothetical protein